MTSPSPSQPHQIDSSVGRRRAARLATVVTGVASVSLVLVLAGCGGSTAVAGAPLTSTPPTTLAKFRQPGDPNSVICGAAMTKKIDGQLTDGRVVDKPIRTVTATSTTCTYRLDKGSLRLRVENAKNNDDASNRYSSLRGAAGTVTGVPHLGTSAFTTGAGTTVTIVGDQVLIVDLTKISSSNDRAQIGQSLSFQILTRFNG